MNQHHILDSSNNHIAVTNFGASDITVKTLSGAPLGTVAGSVTGEIGLKTINVSPAVASTSTTAATFSQGRKVVTTADNPVTLVAATTLVESVKITARKNDTTANTGLIFVGFSAIGGANYEVLSDREFITFTAPAGKKLNLALIYIDAATSLDAVHYTATN